MLLTNNVNNAHVNAYGNSEEEIGPTLSIQRDRPLCQSRLVPAYTNLRVVFSALSLANIEDITRACGMRKSVAMPFISDRHTGEASRKKFMPSITMAIVLERLTMDDEMRNALFTSADLKIYSYDPSAVGSGGELGNDADGWYTKHLTTLRDMALKERNIHHNPLTRQGYYGHFPSKEGLSGLEIKDYINGLLLSYLVQGAEWIKKK